MKGPAVLSAAVKGSCFHLSKVSSLSQGLSFLCVEGITKRRKVKEGGEDLVYVFVYLIDVVRISSTSVFTSVEDLKSLILAQY